jgi:hypothetical protein
MEYPKIETLYDRDEKTHKVITTRTRLPEFENIKRWWVTEKIDGTNIRVIFSPGEAIRFRGRTDKAQMPAPLLSYLEETFTPEKMQSVFPQTGNSPVILFGEGYGEKIQNGGNYRKGVAFRLVDVMVGAWWLEPANVEDIAGQLGIRIAPVLPMIDALPTNAADLADILGHEGKSATAIQDGGAGCRAEGIVARTRPLLLTRRGDRLMWKLKFRDF